MKWPLRNGGAAYLRDVTGTVQTVQYSDSQCTVYTATILARASTLVACRALLYNTTTFYTVHVLFYNFLYRKNLFLGIKKFFVNCGHIMNNLDLSTFF